MTAEEQDQLERAFRVEADFLGLDDSLYSVDVYYSDRHQGYILHTEEANWHGLTKLASYRLLLGETTADRLYEVQRAAGYWVENFPLRGSE